jgi:NAD(P)-dependent dehydrogenase (short-subunit alcohol dehydrogenase family)
MGMGELEGKVAIVTGGGSGLGREAALEYAKEGAAVVVSSRVPQEDGSVAAECQALGARALAISADVRSEAEVNAVVDGCISEFGRVDILLAGAGIAGTADEAGTVDFDQRLHMLTKAQWQMMLDINLTGVFLAARAVVPHMIRQGTGGSIAAISSAAVRFPALRAGGAYVVSKFGLEGLTKKMAYELNSFDIRANMIQPGGQTYTPILGRRYAKGRADHMHEPSVIRGLALYIASDESRMISGRSLVADEFNRQRGLQLCVCARCNTRPNPLEAEWHEAIAL